MARKHSSLDIMKMYSTLTLEHWRDCLRKAVKSSSIEKLMSWRYGLQSGLSDAASKGVTTPEIDLWVIKRCRDLEKCAKFILRKKHPMPGDVISKTHKGQRFDFAMDAKEAKKKRDRDFEQFLRKSNF